MAIKLNGKKLLRQVEIISIIIVTLLLIIYLITVVSASPSFYTDLAAKNAKANFEADMTDVSAPAESHYEKIYQVVDQVKYADEVGKIEEVLKSYADDDSVGTLRYFSHDVAYAYSGEGIKQLNGLDQSILDLAKNNEVGCTPVYYDQYLRMNCVAFFVPVRGSLCIDGLVSVMPAVDVINVGETIRDNTAAIAVVDANGNVVSSLTDKITVQDIGSNVVNYFQTATEGKETVDIIKGMLSSSEIKTAEVTMDSKSYTVVVEPVAIFDGQVYLLTLSESNQLIPAQFDYAGQLTFALIVAILALAAGATFAILFFFKVESAVESANLINATLDCPNIEGFKKNTAELLRRKTHDCAVSVYSLKRFHFIEDRFGAKASLDLMKYIKEVLSTICGEHETFGYAGDGKFLVFSDFKNESIYRNRLLVFEGVINKYDLLKDNQVKVQVAAGVYVVNEERRRPVSDMIDCAMIVCEDAKSNPNLTYAIYTDIVREKISQNEHMEARMEAALGSNEFRLFLQPKYNVERDEIDSAEALVRWFDYQKGDYRFPAEFISLFESNGFIVEMDHFIYLEVLKYLSEAKSRGDKVVPISVNVSRVTAASADFINFYVGNKSRYMIDDGLITLEFTESYATEDYQKLSEIITALHQGGLRCSIDDFGVGYSSFRILKELQMDELKLDRLFLSKGVNVARDDKIIMTITDLAQSCGMTVVMEGVENKAMFDRVVQMGIGVIQGYYYAKAISLEEFKIFINSNTSIRYKAYVK